MYFIKSAKAQTPSNTRYIRETSNQKEKKKIKKTKKAWKMKTVEGNRPLVTGIEE